MFFAPKGFSLFKYNKTLRSGLSQDKCHDFVRNHLETSCYHKMDHDEAIKWSSAGVYKYVVGEANPLPMYPGIVAKAEKEKKLREAAKAKSEVEERFAKIRRIQKGAEPSAKGWRSAPAPVPPSRSRSRSRSSRSPSRDVKQDVSDQEKKLADLKEEVIGLDREHKLLLINYLCEQL